MKVTYIPDAKLPYLNQIKHNGCEFATFKKENEENKQLGNFYRCIDYRNEELYGSFYRTRAAIYGFVFSGDKVQIDFNNVNSLIRNPLDLNFKNKLEQVKQFINSFEDEMGIEKTTIELAENQSEEKHDVLVAVGSKDWLVSPQMLSLYTFMLRIGFSGDEKLNWRELVEKIVEGKVEAYCGQQDKNRLIVLDKHFNNLVNNQWKEVWPEDKDLKYYMPKGTSMNFIHSYSGIQSWFGGSWEKIIKKKKKSELDDDSDGNTK